ncbi:hypothetical protein [Stenotrophomonas acidaminiphila]|uniref:hypothetical protein n=1 Tax=Stenotrophomonas acidaminiphila TaxID=128780 RepID=UPI0015F49DC0|nr:hypothetical protein [Stenotrophomonas acidaminiphila]
MGDTVTLSEDLPAGPLGLLQLADTFHRAGYVKLAGSMRRWADELAAARERRNQHEPLQVAARYADWLKANGRGTSFSTFVNEFGYQEADASKVYQNLILPALQLLEDFHGR